MDLFGRKPRVIPTSGILIKESMEELDFRPDIIAKFEFPETPPWSIHPCCSRGPVESRAMLREYDVPLSIQLFKSAATT